MRKNKGFTLVELLIVIIIIGILAAGMMMVMGSSTDKAAATRGVSDLRSMASAVVQLYADNQSAQAADFGTVAANKLVSLEPYMNKTLVNTQYGMDGAAIAGQVWVAVKLPGTAGAGNGACAKFSQLATTEKMDIRGGGAAATAAAPGAALFAPATDLWGWMRAK